MPSKAICPAIAIFIFRLAIITVSRHLAISVCHPGIQLWNQSQVATSFQIERKETRNIKKNERIRKFTHPKAPERILFSSSSFIYRWPLIYKNMKLQECEIVNIVSFRITNS